ncbi:MULTISPECIES: hypothetical protein [Methylotenera]|uniref:hypothetical protein n=1 Tax=Methylotenera TaxID=359407 RepID=UPI000490F9C1|nr:MULTISPECIES: hypothetical protein [Methylotenera]MDP3777561.1 hypothetical protein [Methylotenera sp.]
MKSHINNYKNALIELKHIELELLNGRSHHFRHFVDRYYCYKNGFVNRSGMADWEGMVWHGIVSIEARLLGDRKQVVKEHVVPLRIITQMLTEHAASGDFSCESIADLLDRYLVFATISKREDALLRQNGLTSQMPEGFYQMGNPLHKNLLARYLAVGIQLEEQNG